jgi:hypothetical protein
MKALLFCISFSICISSLTSCIDDDGNTSKAEITYYAVCDENKFIFTNEEDATAYKELILTTLNNLQITNSTFTQKASVDNGYMGNAIYECNQLAIKKYKDIIKGFDLEDVKSDIFAKNQDALGVGSIDEIHLEEFTATLYLRSSSITDIDTIYHTFR